MESVGYLYFLFCEYGKKPGSASPLPIQLQHYFYFLSLLWYKTDQFHRAVHGINRIFVAYFVSMLYVMIVRNVS